ncbi:(R,S)-reticuline 7-O-methyltransferase-like isoform X2 [Prosopis cineraria]|uniref:(R,S)-reticuline 7-O-methyltransferase-like isoform X2 n=1 Tax=Prosopis cineraria TaxID=364024 RepID=UPI00240F81FA|nr:(R,S)-reticuline 7-O-methyltransferase-like isoform X2 [Prosopis cineraria]
MMRALSCSTRAAGLKNNTYFEDSGTNTMENVFSKMCSPVALKGQPVQANPEEVDELLGQVEIWHFMTSFTDSVALKVAVELRIADIIDHHGQPISLQKIVDDIADAPNPEISFLYRIMRVLVRRKIFSTHQSESGETLYGLTRASKWLLRDTKMTLSPMILLENHPIHLNPAHHIGECIREGTENGTAFFKCHGHEQFDLTGLEPDYNRLFNEGMVCTARITSKAVISGYKDGFNKIQSLVDVGGGIGGSLSEIVRAYPHIKGINFDLPHVVATAPKYDGITHVGGNMFESIPKADAIYMKWILHDWSDQHCIQILKNCRKAIPEKTGKVIIVDHVLQPEGNNGLFDEVGYAFDMMLLAHNAGGRERTEQDWKRLFEETGFPRYNIIKIKALQSIIEAFPI